VKDENGDLVADSSNILNRWMNVNRVLKECILLCWYNFIISIPSKHNYHHIYFDTTCFGSTEPSSVIYVSLLNCYAYVNIMITLQSLIINYKIYSTK
jgi:hypothetical protein